MPIPESRMLNAMPSFGAVATDRLTLPLCVNFTALDSRFLSTCSRRWRSVNSINGAPSCISTRKSSCLSVANGWNRPCRPSTRRATLVFSGRISSLPASTLEISRMSLIRLSKSLPAE
ncbi:hypothetical protein D3C71_1579220 [compost metagenome]